MTSMLHPLAAVLMMGSTPLAFEVDPAFMMPAAAPAPMIHMAQATGPQTPAVEPPPAEVEADVEATSPSGPASAQGELSEAERKAILKNAAEKLSDVKTARGRFTQVAADGNVTRGDFALRRPGRMRFEYDDPTPILIVANGTTVAMEDSELETVDRVPLASTPLGLILDEELDYETDARVLDVQRGNQEVSITVEDRAGESEGRLTLFFDRESYDLKSWRAVDANRQTTLVSLEDVEKNVSIDPREFILEDPADEEEDER
ncbi:outer membrane lipoprotein carrier protein LolA [Henriciella sp.]|uniref:LolA family protein n=1 Tax=Henriciella sp. TaxID=1968823 RepID=UPI0026263AA2|nr:outer membrane lipoprotein carrier protein LolA [Henriciella sp.]